MRTNQVLLDATGIDSSHRLRGIGRYVNGLIKGFETLFHTKEYPDLCLNLLRIHPQGHPNPSFGKTVVVRRVIRTAEFPHWVENRLRLRRDLRRLASEMDLYHSTDPYSLAPWLENSVPTLATCYDLIPIILEDSYGRITANIYFQWARKAYQKVSGIIVLSQTVKRSLMDFFGIPSERIAVVLPGVEERFFEDRDCEPLLAEPPYFLYAGGIDKRKNVETILESLAEIRKDVPENLILCGSWDPKRKRCLLALVTKLGISDRVHFLKYVKDEELIALYQRATAFVFPSLYEGFGFPVLEAQAAGCPVITTRLAALPEAARDAALYIEGTGGVESIGCLSSAMRTLSRDHLERERLSRLGRANAAVFTWEKTATNTIEVYRRALNRSLPLDAFSQR